MPFVVCPWRGTLLARGRACVRPAGLTAYGALHVQANWPLMVALAREPLAGCLLVYSLGLSSNQVTLLDGLGCVPWPVRIQGAGSLKQSVSWLVVLWDRIEWLCLCIKWSTAMVCLEGFMMEGLAGSQAKGREAS